MSEQPSKKNIEKELTRGLTLALDKFGSIPGMQVHSEHFLKASLIKSPDGYSLNFHLQSPYENQRDLPVPLERSMTEFLGTLEDEFTEKLKTVKKGTFEFITGQEPASVRDPKALEEDVVQYHAVQARTLDDLSGGLNTLLTELGVAKDDRIILGRGK